MEIIEIIGNIGADIKEENFQGKTFYSFNVACNSKYNDREYTQWYGCTMQRVSDNLRKYLVKGQAVFVRGVPRYRVFDSAVHRCKMVGISIFVNEIELCGSAPERKDNTQANDSTPAANTQQGGGVPAGNSQPGPSYVGDNSVPTF